MDEEKKLILIIGQQVGRLKRGETIKYLTPVAYKRAKTMLKVFNYAPQVYNEYTLKTNRYYAEE